MTTDNIQDIYELSPIQKGILFHSLYAPELALYFIQFSYTLHGDLDLAAFDLAWQQVVARHTALRTSFYWENLDNPLQVVHRQIRVPLEQQDWQETPPDLQQQRLESFLKRDRQRGFDFSQPPLIRLTLIRLNSRTYQFVFSKHHLILDGWSSSLVLKEFVQIYTTLCQGQELPSAPGSAFGDYITWLQQQDLPQAKAYWRQILSNFRAPTPLTNLEADNWFGLEDRYDEERIQLSATTTARLQSLARRHQLTVNTFVQGAWAFLLSYYSCQKDVVYGCTVSARPVSLAAAESMVGAFVNTLPVRVEVNREQLLLPWLKQLQAQQVEMRQYDYSPLVEVQGCSNVPRGTPLFESIVVFENFPVDRLLREWKGNIEIQDSSSFYKTNYPLTVVAYPGSELTVGISYDCRRFDATTISAIAGHFQTLLQGMVMNPEGRLQDLSLLTPEQQFISQLLAKEATFNFDFAQRDAEEYNSSWSRL